MPAKPKQASSEPSLPKVETTETALPDLSGAIEDLKELALKPKKYAPEKVVKDGFEQIKRAIEQGYSYTDIARVFVKRGVKISAKELKEQYELMEGESEKS